MVHYILLNLKIPRKKSKKFEDGRGVNKFTKKLNTILILNLILLIYLYVRKVSGLNLPIYTLKKTERILNKIWKKVTLRTCNVLVGTIFRWNKFLFVK